MSQGPYRVLVVEDDSDDEALTLRALRGWDGSLVLDVVHSGRQAIAALGLFGEEPPPLAPRLVLCDLCLRDAKADELVRSLRKEPRLSEVPFVVFTSSHDPMDEARCIEAGVTAYAIKPVGYEEYKRLVAHLAERWIDRGADVP